MRSDVQTTPSLMMVVCLCCSGHPLPDRRMCAPMKSKHRHIDVVRNGLGRGWQWRRMSALVTTQCNATNWTGSANGEASVCASVCKRRYRVSHKYYWYYYFFLLLRFFCCLIFVRCLFDGWPIDFMCLKMSPHTQIWTINKWWTECMRNENSDRLMFAKRSHHFNDE